MLNFTRLTAKQIKVGDILAPNPLWNDETERPLKHLPAKCHVIGVQATGASQTGVKVLIKGYMAWLDAGWFRWPE